MITTTAITWPCIAKPHPAISKMAQLQTSPYLHAVTLQAWHHYAPSCQQMETGLGAEKQVP